MRGQWPQTEAMFGRVFIQNPEVEDSQTKRKILSMQEASLTEGLWQQSSDALSLKAFSAHQIALAGQTQSLLQLPLLNINNFRIEKNNLNTGRIALTGGEANCQFSILKCPCERMGCKPTFPCQVSFSCLAVCAEN